jgi:hypothetical protein
MGRRITFLVFISVFFSEEPHINVASFHFIQIEFICPSILSRYILEKKNIIEPPKKRVTP